MTTRVELKFFRPIICGPDGFWWGGFCCLARSEADAFRRLEEAIRNGLVKMTRYGELER